MGLYTLPQQPLFHAATSPDTKCFSFCSYLKGSSVKNLLCSKPHVLSRNLSPGGLKLFHALLQAPAAAECLKPADSPQSASKLSHSKVMRFLRLLRFKAVTCLNNTRVFIGCQF